MIKILLSFHVLFIVKISLHKFMIVMYNDSPFFQNASLVVSLFQLFISFEVLPVKVCEWQLLLDFMSLYKIYHFDTGI